MVRPRGLDPLLVAQPASSACCGFAPRCLKAELQAGVAAIAEGQCMTIKSAESQKRMQRRTNNESTDGTDFPGSIGQHGSQDRLLAGGIRGALLCVPRCWRGCDTSLAK